MTRNLNETNAPLVHALSRAGGVTQLAKKLGISRQAVSQWKDYGYVPLSRIGAVRDVTGLSPATLRPDLARYFSE